jgi:hypothetical protein
MSNIFNGLDTSDRLKGILASRGKTFADLATLLELTTVTISSRMKDNTWKVEELKKVAAAYEVKIQDLI